MSSDSPTGKNDLSASLREVKTGKKEPDVLRLAIVVSHPIQHFDPWHRELARVPGIELRVFFINNRGLEEYFDKEFGRRLSWDIPLTEGYDHEFLEFKKKPKRYNFWTMDNPTVAGALDRFQPDVVKVFGYAYRTNWRVARWAGRNRRPLMIFSDSIFGKHRPWWKRPVREPIVRKFYSLTDGALYVGDNNREYHRHYGLPPERLFSGMLPIDQSRLLSSVPDQATARSEIRREYGIPEDAFVVAFCGKFAPHKRPLDLVVAGWKAAQSGAPVWSLMVGDGSERPEVESYCKENGVTNAILTGFVNQTKIPAHLAAADALAVTSERDAHPLVVTEAATFGLPVIASDRIGCIGPNDTARPDVNALAYPCADLDALCEAILRLYGDSELYKRLSRESVEIARGQDVKVAARALADAARQLVKLGPR